MLRLRRPQAATKLKPLRALQFLLAMFLFHLSTYLMSISETYMSMTSCFMLLTISTIYVSILSTAIMSLKDHDIIRINPMFALSSLGIPLFIIVGIICYASPMSDSSFWAVKMIILLCFTLSGCFLFEVLIVLSQYRR